MQTLGLSLRTKGSEGEPLPPVFRQLEMLGAKLRRGQLSLIAAAPNGGKSAIMKFWTLHLDYTGYGDRVPSIYFSADSDKMSFGKDIVANVLGVHLSEAERLLLVKDEEALRAVDDATQHMWVNFDSSPSPKDIADEVEAFAHVYGDYPHLVVVDNLMDVASMDSDERMGQDAILDFLKQIARRTEAAVVVLMHVTGEHENGDKPIPRSGLMNKLSKRPRLILTLYNAGDNLLGVCVVKNSNGRADASGNLKAFLPWLPERGFFGTGK